MQRPILGLGEILWDLLPDGPQLGGAPFNFTYHCHQLGWPAVMISRIGNDIRGDQIEDRLAELGLPGDHVQLDGQHPTGTVTVTVDAAGQPTYTIHENVAWDYLADEEPLEFLVSEAAAICFGSLIQRHPVARATVQRLLASESPALRVFDVNLRQHYWTREVLEVSLSASNWVKLNDEELRVLGRLFNFPTTEAEAVDLLCQRFGVDLVCLTRGANGCLVRTANETIEEPGIAVQVVDTVGAGDSFTAALVVGVLEGRPLAEAVRRANRLAAQVAASRGGTPRIDPATL